MGVLEQLDCWQCQTWVYHVADGRRCGECRYRPSRRHSDTLGEPAITGATTRCANSHIEEKYRVAPWELGTADFPYDTDRYYRLKVESRGSKIRAYIDDKLILSAEDAEIPRGKTGLSANIPARYRDFRVSCDPDDEARHRRARSASASKSSPDSRTRTRGRSSGSGSRPPGSAPAGTPASATSTATVQPTC